MLSFRAHSLRLLAVLALATHALAAQQVRPGLSGTATDSTRKQRALGTIDGVVSDSNLVPIQAAQVSIVRTNVRVGTGPNGRFRIVDVPPGQYLVIVRRVGFHPTSAIVEVPPATDTLRLSYTLDRLTVMLDTVVISEKRLSLRMMEFESRRKAGFGQFMTQDEIEKRNSVYATELFRKFPSVNVSPSMTSAMPVYYALSRRETGDPNYGACPLQLFLDNIKLPTPFNLDLLPSPKEIAGIEVYAGPGTTPPQFAGYNTGCGVILIWTRDGY